MNKHQSLYYITPLTWAVVLLLRWVTFSIDPDNLQFQKTTGCLPGALILIPYVVFAIFAIKYLFNFRREWGNLVEITAYILLFDILYSLAYDLHGTLGF